MKKIKQKKILFAVIIAAGLIVYLFILPFFFQCRNISCLEIKDRQDYKIKEIYEDNKFIHRAIYSNKNILLKAEIRLNYTESDAEQVIKTQLVRTKGLFENAAAPYPGELSDVIACSNAYKPVYSSRVQNGISISYFEGYVNKRLVFGSCADDQAEYHDTLTMFYCPEQKKFYQVEIIIPNKDFKANPKINNAILTSIGCKKIKT